MNKKFALIAVVTLCVSFVMLGDAKKGVEVNKETITLNGKAYDIGLVRAISLSMSSFNKIIRQELHQKALNPKHKLYAVIARVLKEHGLIDAKGNLKSGIEGIIREYEDRRKKMTLLDFLRSGGNPFEYEKEKK